MEEPSALTGPAEDHFPPLHEWAMDPAILCFRKVFIQQIHKHTEVIPYSGHLLFYLRKRPILKVHVVGVVVCAEIRQKKITYHVDDGTGVVRCVQYLSGEILHMPITYAVGDVVMVKGNLEMYETNTELYGFAIKISIVEELMDMNLETYHMAAALTLFKDGL